MKNLVASVTVAVLLAACAGTSFDWNQARSVKPGMTSAELQKIMGAPYMVSTRGDQTIWVYSQANGFTGSTRTVSFVLKDEAVVGVPTIPTSF
ncbi:MULTISPECIES: outer membrane protein assembly factor BamE domain-containing protein [unclassified Cupriavidus]|uniref:outer membrane protein assembly factor BamE domain-containing protein n=1 Tax=Cupriavidus sp. H19C3 TaxID=3241603 RepID=UPI003BF8EFAE